MMTIHNFGIERTGGFGLENKHLKRLRQIQKNVQLFSFIKKMGQKNNLMHSLVI
jgi:hypothetical protein